MDLIASFSAHKIRTSHFLTVDGIIRDGVLHFLFDTGAAVSLIGLNSIFLDDEDDNRKAFEKVVRSEFEKQGVSCRSQTFRTVTNQGVKTYPCVSHGVSIEGTKKIDFYFDLSLEDVSLPLLGTSFTDDCSYNHSISGLLTISGMKENPGADFYKGYNVLDFDKVMESFTI